MTVDDWPILCQHLECRGTATPALWVIVVGNSGGKFYCQRHMQGLFNTRWKNPDHWVKLTPNQRPSQVQEAHSGND